MLAIIVDVTGYPIHKIKDPSGNKDLQFCRWAFLSVMIDNFWPTFPVNEFARMIDRDITNKALIDRRMKNMLEVLEYRIWLQKIQSKYKHTTT